jgi:hypothetical protein
MFFDNSISLSAATCRVLRYRFAHWPFNVGISLLRGHPKFLGPLGESWPLRQFLDVFEISVGPFERFPRIFNKIWGKHIGFAARGLAILTCHEKLRAKLDKLIKLEELDALNGKPGEGFMRLVR